MPEHTQLAFETLADALGVEIVDRVEQLRYQLHTPEQVSPTPVPTEEFHFPVGRGVRMHTQEFVLPSVVSVFVRDGDGDMVSEIEHLDSESLGPGEYILELSTQIKTYIEIEGPVGITADLLEVRFEFAEETAVDVGVRSRHNRPAATITTTEDPTDLMTAISSFGSALKSTSPERSFPTLRGHPPAVELGDKLAVPPSVDPPDTGITLEVPPAYDAIFPLASLSYYLGAEVVSGGRPRLVTDTGFEYAFDYPEGYEDDVARTLKQVFLLDCLARTEGFYAVDLHERNALDPHLDLDWAALYDAPLTERVASYLSVPYDILAEHVPEWRLTADTVEQLPFVVDDLAVVRTVDTGQWGCSSPGRRVAADGAGEDALTRSASPTDRPTDSPSTADPVEDDVSRSVSSTTQRDDATYVEFEAADSLEQAWLGEGVPVGASKLIPAAFRNRLDREVTAGDIGITIVLNDDRMAEERDLVDGAYGDRQNLPFDVTVRRNLTVEGLREEFHQDQSFLHYIGHTDEEGFECTDGKLDVGTLDETGVDAFLLNACKSYQQGVDLIEAGAIGGIVTLSDVFNEGAVRMGETISRLLNAGFPLRAALTVARDESILGGQYIIVGDGGVTVAQAPGRTPVLFNISNHDEEYRFDIRTFLTDDADIGSMYLPNLEKISTYYLSSGTIDTFNLDRDSVEEFLDLAKMPMRIDGSLEWTCSTDVEEI
ncbi:hypothetical protein BRD19_04140 [Halobacteriales archaeon SW_7_65_23]|nr:MAG: hypothetical protein BRD19_04140 [Halobacteriales archaeon SW_7_65_23]